MTEPRVPTSTSESILSFVVIGFIGAMVTGALVIGFLRSTNTVDLKAHPTYVTDHVVRRNDAVSIALGRSDGMAFAALARDPLLQKPEVFAGAREHAAFRMGRPLLGWVTWSLSMGNADAIPGVMVGLTIVAGGWTAAALAALARLVGVHPIAGLVSVVLPGAWASVWGLGPELLGIALATTGMVLLIQRRPSVTAALCCFVLAVLARETMIVAAAVAGGVMRSEIGTRRAVAILVVPGAVLAAWWIVVYLRVGAWGFAHEPKAIGIPFGGIVQAIHGWMNQNGTDWLVAACGAILVVLAVLHRIPMVSQVVLAYTGLGLLLTVATWGRWEDFGRVLAPLYCYGAVLVVGVFGNRRPIDAKPRTSVRWRARLGSLSPAWPNRSSFVELVSTTSRTSTSSYLETG